MRPVNSLALACVVVALVSALPASAATITVTSVADAGGTCPGANCTLRQAIATATAGSNLVYDPLTDGFLIIRYLFGLTGSSLTADAIGAAPTRSLPGEVLPYLDSIRPVLDVDGNTQVDALTDGLLLVRYLAGSRGTSLTTGATGPGTMRTTGQIQTYIQSLMP